MLFCTILTARQPHKHGGFIVFESKSIFFASVTNSGLIYAINTSSFLWFCFSLFDYIEKTSSFQWLKQIILLQYLNSFIQKTFTVPFLDPKNGFTSDGRRCLKAPPAVSYLTISVASFLNTTSLESCSASGWPFISNFQIYQNQLLPRKSDFLSTSGHILLPSCWKTTPV